MHDHRGHHLSKRIPSTATSNTGRIPRLCYHQATSERISTTARLVADCMNVTSLTCPSISNKPHSIQTPIFLVLALPSPVLELPLPCPTPVPSSAPRKRRQPLKSSIQTRLTPPRVNSVAASVLSKVIDTSGSSVPTSLIQATDLAYSLVWLGFIISNLLVTQWTAHLQSKQHRSSIARQKEQDVKRAAKRPASTTASQGDSLSSTASAATTTTDTSHKKRKVSEEEPKASVTTGASGSTPIDPSSNLPSNFFSNPALAPPPPPPSTTATPSQPSSTTTDATKSADVDDELSLFLSSIAS